MKYTLHYDDDFGNTHSSISYGVSRALPLFNLKLRDIRHNAHNAHSLISNQKNKLNFCGCVSQCFPAINYMKRMSKNWNDTRGNMDFIVKNSVKKLENLLKFPSVHKESG